LNFLLAINILNLFRNSISWNDFSLFTFYLILISPYIFITIDSQSLKLIILFYYHSNYFLSIIHFIFVSIIMYYLLYNFLLTEAVKKSIRNISFLGLNFYLTFIYFPKCLSINCFFLDSSQQNTPKCTKHVDEHVNWRRISLCKYSHQEQTALWVRCPYRLSDFSTTLFNKVNQTHAEYIL